MTHLLNKAIDRARKLPRDQQDALGAVMLDEIADEARWSRTFSESRHVVEAMVARADAEIDAGEVAPLEFPRRK